MMQHVVVRSGEQDWVEGIFHLSEYRYLWSEKEEGKETQAFIVKFAPGGFIPEHDHPGREYAYVLEGSMWVGEDLLQAGDFLTAGLGEIHDVRTDTGVTFFIVIEKPIAVTANSDE